MGERAISRRRFTALAAAVVASPGLLAQPRGERSRVTLALSSKAAFYHLPLTIADQLDYFRSEGADVELIEVNDSPRAMQSIAGGAADVVSGPYEHTIQLQSRNQAFQAFVLQNRAPQIAMGVSTRALPAYRELTELRGRRIGVSAPGSSTNMVATRVLARAGVKDSEVSYVGVGTSSGALLALRTGQVDAMCNTEPVMTMLEQKGEVKIVGDTRTLKGTQEVFGGPMPATCLYASADFIQKHPAVCQALANAIVHSLKWLQTAGPSDIIKTVPEAYLLGDRALYLASFDKVREAISLDGMITEEGTRTALRAMASFDPALRADKIDLGKTYTNEFTRRAREKHKA